MTVPLRTLSFDADGTLWDFEATMRMALARTIDYLVDRDEQFAGLTVDDLIDARHRVGVRHRDEVQPMEVLRRLGFEEALALIPGCTPQILDDATDFYLAERFANPILFDDVVDALEILSERFELALVSNGNSDPERCGLPGMFTTTVLAEQVGVSKPDPRIYGELLDRIGRNAAEVVHIGDSLPSDIDAAQRAGLGAIWINRAGQRAVGSTSKPDATVRSLRELPSLLDAWPPVPFG